MQCDEILNTAPKTTNIKFPSCKPVSCIIHRRIEIRIVFRLIFQIISEPFCARYHKFRIGLLLIVFFTSMTHLLILLGISLNDCSSIFRKLHKVSKKFFSDFVKIGFSRDLHCTGTGIRLNKAPRRMGSLVI